MSTHHHTELDSGITDSVTTSPHPDHPSNPTMHEDPTLPRVRFMCSFGGKILPRPHDNQLRYVGGDTRIVAMNRHTTFSSLLNKLSKLYGTTNISIKYQLPNEDLDALITVTTDDDVENMMEEYERLAHNHNFHSKTARLRLFLFPTDSDSLSRATSISSLLDGSAKREHWFLDALNGGAGPSLERGRSEVSSIVSEVPDYLFGLDNSDEPTRESRLKTRPVLNDNVSVSDPGSPAPVVSSPFCSTSSSLGPPGLPTIPDLRPVKTKPDNPACVVESQEAHIENVVDTGESIGYSGKTSWHYIPGSNYPGQAVQNIPFYYIPGSVPPGNVPVRVPYVQSYPAPPGQIPVGPHHQVAGMGQVYGGAVRPISAMDPYDMSGRVVLDGVSQPMYYGVRNAGVAPAYRGMVVMGGEEVQGSGPEAKTGRVP